MSDQAKIEEMQLQQLQCWNGEMGETWVKRQGFIDAMLRPFETLLVNKVKALGPKNILDVGCGNGRTTFAMADALSPEVQCTGIDLSEPMIANARSQQALNGLPVSLICADAAAHHFEAKKFDLVCSRFGVMFFSEPSVAFSNLRHAAKDEARLLLIVWRSRREQDFMTLAHRAASAILPDMPPVDPDAPGPFSLGVPDVTTAMLRKSGWDDIRFEPLDVACSFPKEDLDMFLNELAPIGYDTLTLDENTLLALHQEIRKAYEPFIQGETVRFDAPCWVIEGRAAIPVISEDA